MFYSPAAALSTPRLPALLRSANAGPLRGLQQTVCPVGASPYKNMASLLVLKTLCLFKEILGIPLHVSVTKLDFSNEFTRFRFQ